MTTTAAILVSVAGAMLLLWVACLRAWNTSLMKGYEASVEPFVSEATELTRSRARERDLTYRNEYLWALQNGHGDEEAKVLAASAVSLKYEDDDADAFHGIGVDE